MLDTVAQDTRYALRWLLRSPGFASVAILSLALGIGLNTAIFAVVDALLLRPIPVAEPSRLVDIYTSGADGDTYSTNSLPDLQDYRDQTTVFEDIAGYSPMFAAVNRGEQARLVLGEIVTGNYFSVLGVPARLGRTLLPEDDAPDAPRVVVLSARYWRRDFGSEVSVIGRTLRIRGQQFTIVGVLDDDFTGMVPMLAPEVWLPVRWVEDVEPAGINETVPSPTGTSPLDRRGRRWLFVKARLTPDVSVEQARANLAIVAGRLRSDHPQTNKDRRVTLRPSNETRIHPEGDAILAWLVTGAMAAVILVLMIACANVAGMLLARASARRREIGVRLALGAGRSRLLRQLLTESLVLAMLGAASGVAIAWWVTRLLSTFDLPIPVPLSLDLRLDARVLGFSIVAALATGVLTGLSPALGATRRNLVTDLKAEIVTERIAGRRWTARDVLAVGQIAITLVLLVTAGLLVRSLFAGRAADVGFRTEGVAIVSADTNMLRYTPERSQQFWSEVQRRMQAIPGVSSVALASRVPFSLNFSRTNVAVPGHQKAADEMGPSIISADVSPEYFATLGIAVLQGRPFRESDTSERRPVAVINETMARRYWARDTPVGQIVYERTLNSGRSFEIVGVVADHKLQTVGEMPQAAIYFAKPQRPSGYNVLVARTAADEGVLLAQMRTMLIDMEPNLLLIESQTMRGQISATLLPIRIAASLVTVFSGLGLLLAAIGLYGVIAYAVSRRTREIGIRIAIGARSASILALVMRRGLMLIGLGLGLGLLLAALATRIVAGALYGIGAADPVTWSAAVIVVTTIALVANVIPARRALRVDPIQALRAE